MLKHKTCPRLLVRLADEGDGAEAKRRDGVKFVMVRREQRRADAHGESKAATIGNGHFAPRFKPACFLPEGVVEVCALNNPRSDKIRDGASGGALTSSAVEIVEDFTQVDRVRKTLAARIKQRSFDDIAARLVTQVGDHR